MNSLVLLAESDAYRMYWEIESQPVDYLPRQIPKADRFGKKAKTVIEVLIDFIAKNAVN